MGLDGGHPADQEILLRLPGFRRRMPGSFRVLWIIKAVPKSGIGGEKFLGRAPDGSVDPYMRTSPTGTPVWTSKEEADRAVKKAQGFLAIPATYDYETQEIRRHAATDSR